MITYPSGPSVVCFISSLTCVSRPVPFPHCRAMLFGLPMQSSNSLRCQYYCKSSDNVNGNLVRWMIFIRCCGRYSVQPIAVWCAQLFVGSTVYSRLYRQHPLSSLYRQHPLSSQYRQHPLSSLYRQHPLSSLYRQHPLSSLYLYSGCTPISYEYN